MTLAELADSPPLTSPSLPHTHTHGSKKKNHTHNCIRIMMQLLPSVTQRRQIYSQWNNAAAQPSPHMQSECRSEANRISFRLTFTRTQPFLCVRLLPDDACELANADHRRTPVPARCSVQRSNHSSVADTNWGNRLKW